MSVQTPVPCQPLGIQHFKVELESGHVIHNYQRELAELGIQGSNYIIVAPTGSGKTLVAALVIADHLQKHQQNCHVVFIVNTNLLADQQKDELQSLIPEAKIYVCTGDSDMTVAKSIKKNHVSVCTAGKLLNEILKGKVKFSQLSLIVLDECHHARKNDPYAELMKRYLEERQEEDLHVQIIGMTASPGTGKNPYLIERKTIDHLVMLVALLDATSGIKTVVEFTSELEHYGKSSSFTNKFLKSRDHTNDPFINEVTGIMEEIEAGFEDMKLCMYDRWSQEYETNVQSIICPMETSPNEEFRDYINALKHLRCYSTALSIYMDLRNIDAIKAIEEFSVIPENVAKATDYETSLTQKKDGVLVRLKCLDPKENPQLRGIEIILREKFTEKNSSCAILFVRTRKHAVAMKSWILNHQELKALNVTPDIITGHTWDTDTGMTRVKQEEVMKLFHDGKINVLIATSVAEKGLDVPACNLIIRYFHVSNEIAKVQTEGRARAENSDGYTILSSSSKKKYQEMRNEELVMLLDNILENSYFPTGKDLREKITQLQEEIIQEKKMKKPCSRKKVEMTYAASSVKLHCKKCKTFACLGSDVRNVQTLYLVCMPEFRKKFVAKPHPKPRYLTGNIFKIHKIYCFECESDWGVECIWPGKQRHPAIKCSNFIFIHMDGQTIPLKKWGNVPFQVQPLNTKIKLKSESKSDRTSS